MLASAPARPMSSQALSGLRKLPLRDTVWYGTRRPLNVLVEGKQVDACVWFDADMKVRSACIALRGEDPDVLGILLVQALAAPMAPCKPGRPTALAVLRGGEDPLIRRLITDLRIKSIKDADPTPVDAVLDDLQGALDRGPGFSYMACDNVDLAVICNLHRAAVQYDERAIWEGICDSMMARVSGPGMPTVLVSILGLGEEVYGAAIYLTEEAARTMLAGVTDVTRISQPILLFDLSEEEDCGPLVAAEAKKHGWPLPLSGSFPIVSRVDKPGVLPTMDEVRLTTDVLDALCATLPGRLRVDRDVVTPSGRKLHVEWPVVLTPATPGKAKTSSRARRR